MSTTFANATYEDDIFAIKQSKGFAFSPIVHCNPGIVDQNMCDLAVSLNPTCLEFVPNQYKTPQVCLEAVINKNWPGDYYALRFVSDECVFCALIDMIKDNTLTFEEAYLRYNEEHEDQINSVIKDESAIARMDNPRSLVKRYLELKKGAVKRVLWEDWKLWDEWKRSGNKDIVQGECYLIPKGGNDADVISLKKYLLDEFDKIESDGVSLDNYDLYINQ